MHTQNAKEIGKMAEKCDYSMEPSSHFKAAKSKEAKKSAEIELSLIGCLPYISEGPRIASSPQACTLGQCFFAIMYDLFLKNKGLDTPLIWLSPKLLCFSWLETSSDQIGLSRDNARQDFVVCVNRPFKTLFMHELHLGASSIRLQKKFDCSNQKKKFDG
jgi:hypothetical protein